MTDTEKNSNGEARSRAGETRVALSIAIMTFNVYMDGFKDPDGASSTLKAIHDSACDIVCLQESNAGWQTLIEEDGDHHLTGTFPYRQFYHDMGNYGGRAVLSRWPILGQEWFPRVFPWWYGAQFVRIQIPNESEPLRILNLHLRAPFPSNPLVVQQQRLEEIKQHIGRIPPQERSRLVVLGDFNNPNGPSHVHLQKHHNMSNCLRHARPTAVYFSSTWHYGPFGRLYDHIYVSKDDFVVKDASIRKVGGSDHWPLVVSVELLSSRTGGKK